MKYEVQKRERTRTGGDRNAGGGGWTVGVKDGGKEHKMKGWVKI